jgi:hypothetical protein
MTELAGIKYLTPELILIGAASVLIVLDLLFKRKEIVAFAGVLGCLAAIFAGAALFVSSDSATGLRKPFQVVLLSHLHPHHLDVAEISGDRRRAVW